MITDAQKPCRLAARIISNLTGKPCKLAAASNLILRLRKLTGWQHAVMVRLGKLQSGHLRHFKADAALRLAAGATSKLILRLRSPAGWQPAPLQSSY